MRRVGNLFPQILEHENLCRACWRAAKGKRQRRDVAEFFADFDRNLDELRCLLRDGEFPFGTFTQFPIRDPKPRTITAPAFRERVVHHAIIHVCDPFFERFLIGTTYACRCGKGRLAAIRRAHRNARLAQFFLKMDVRSFFDSIDHAKLLGLLERRFKDQRLLAVFHQIIDSFHSTPGKGLPIGSLTSQYFANFYLGWLDHFVKHTLRHRLYVRYMDDFVVWADRSESLLASLEAIRTMLDGELCLTPKPEPYVNRTRVGMQFLGCQIFPNRVCLNRRNRQRVGAEIDQLQQRLSVGGGRQDDCQKRLTSLWEFSRGATTVGLRFDS